MNCWNSLLTPLSSLWVLTDSWAFACCSLVCAPSLPLSRPLPSSPSFDELVAQLDHLGRLVAGNFAERAGQRDQPAAAGLAALAALAAFALVVALDLVLHAIDHALDHVFDQVLDVVLDARVAAAGALALGVGRLAVLAHHFVDDLADDVLQELGHASFLAQLLGGAVDGFADRRCQEIGRSHRDAGRGKRDAHDAAQGAAEAAAAENAAEAAAAENAAKAAAAENAVQCSRHDFTPRCGLKRVWLRSPGVAKTLTRYRITPALRFDSNLIACDVIAFVCCTRRSGRLN